MRIAVVTMTIRPRPPSTAAMVRRDSGGRSRRCRYRQHDEEEHDRAGVHDDLRDAQGKGALFAMYRTARPSGADHADDSARPSWRRGHPERRRPLTMAVMRKRMISVDPIMGQPLDRFISSSATRTRLEERGVVQAAARHPVNLGGGGAGDFPR